MPRDQPFVVSLFEGLKVLGNQSFPNPLLSRLRLMTQPLPSEPEEKGRGHYSQNVGLYLPDPLSWRWGQSPVSGRAPPDPPELSLLGGLHFLFSIPNRLLGQSLPSSKNCKVFLLGHICKQKKKRIEVS